MSIKVQDVIYNTEHEFRVFKQYEDTSFRLPN